jgi:hypothetical protein
VCSEAINVMKMGLLSKMIRIQVLFFPSTLNVPKNGFLITISATKINKKANSRREKKTKRRNEKEIRRERSSQTLRSTCAYRKNKN